MRRIGWVLTVAVLVATALSLDVSGGGWAVHASPVNKNVHVHDDFYHPAGAFIVGTGTDHNVAQAACQKANPDAACDAVIQQGDTITWVAPAPSAANQHTVTECTDGTFSVCGPAVSAANPIGDSGVRNPPPAVAPAGWPYGPIQFNVPGTYYYRCEIHPTVMRGRIVVLPAAVGGIAFDPQAGADAFDAAHSTGPGSSVIAAMAAAAALTAVIALGGIAYARRRLAR
jgi:plastocyanin